MIAVFIAAKTAAQQATCELEHCYDAWLRSCCTTCLGVHTRCISSFASEHRIRIFHLPAVLVEQIPYAWCLQCQTFATFLVVVPTEGCRMFIVDWHLSVLEMLKPFVSWHLAKVIITKCFFNTLRTGAFKLYKCTFPGFKQFKWTFMLCFFKNLWQIRWLFLRN
jgi:hypothetical protein